MINLFMGVPAHSPAIAKSDSARNYSSYTPQLALLSLFISLENIIFRGKNKITKLVPIIVINRFKVIEINHYA